MLRTAELDDLAAGLQLSPCCDETQHPLTASTGCPSQLSQHHMAWQRCIAGDQRTHLLMAVSSTPGLHAGCAWCRESWLTPPKSSVQPRVPPASRFSLMDAGASRCQAATPWCWTKHLLMLRPNCCWRTPAGLVLLGTAEQPSRSVLQSLRLAVLATGPGGCL